MKKTSATVWFLSQGMRAYDTGLPRTAYPKNVAGFARRMWLSGWDDAFWGGLLPKTG